VLVDGARFLPGSVTVTKVQAVVWSSAGQQLSGVIEGVALPEGGDCLSPGYAAQGAVGAGGYERFDDPTATVMFQVSKSASASGCRSKGGVVAVIHLACSLWGVQQLSTSTTHPIILGTYD